MCYVTSYFGAVLTIDTNFVVFNEIWLNTVDTVVEKCNLVIVKRHNGVSWKGYQILCIYIGTKFVWYTPQAHQNIKTIIKSQDKVIHTKC